MTAKDDGLWAPMGNVTEEDIRHMKSRMQLFTATEQVPVEILAPVPKCAESWSRWVVAGSMVFATMALPRQPAPLVARALPDLPLVGAGEALEDENQ